MFATVTCCRGGMLRASARCFAMACTRCPCHLRCRASICVCRVAHRPASANGRCGGSDRFQFDCGLQRLVDPRLPPWPGRFEIGQHVTREPQRDQGGARRPPPRSRCDSREHETPFEGAFAVSSSSYGGVAPAAGVIGELPPLGATRTVRAGGQSGTVRRSDQARRSERSGTASGRETSSRAAPSGAWPRIYSGWTAW